MTLLDGRGRSRSKDVRLSEYFGGASDSEQDTTDLGRKVLQVVQTKSSELGPHEHIAD